MLRQSQYYIFFVLVVSAFVFGKSETALAQNLPPSVRCRSAANPRALQHECVGQEIDFNEETWTRDWLGFRTDLDERGIKPTASYTTQLSSRLGACHRRARSPRCRYSINTSTELLTPSQGISLSMTSALRVTRLEWNGAPMEFTTSARGFRLTPAYSTQSRTPQLGEKAVQTSLYNRATVASCR
jgi:hypothetical protein